MLDDKDIEKLVKVFATREEVATKKDLGDLNQKFDVLQNSVDTYAKKADTYFQELAALRSKVNRLEDWITKIAKKVDIELTA